jgi:hypothetical protein
MITFFNDLIKLDTLIAFIIATILQYLNTNNMLISVIFSLKFVCIFLVCLNILNLFNIKNI